MSPHYHHFFHPKPRYIYSTNYLPYYYYYPYDYLSSLYPYYTREEDRCFCTDSQYSIDKAMRVCVNGTCGACVPRASCTNCDDKISCDD
jgi:hypothetical protein